MARAIGARQLGGLDIGARQSPAAEPFAGTAQGIVATPTVGSPTGEFLFFEGTAQGIKATPTVGDGNEAPARAHAGGFIPRPVVYLDDDGNPVDLDALEKTVKAAVDAADLPKQRANAARKALDHVVTDLAAARAASERDMERLRRALKASETALNALERAVGAQRDEEAALVLLLS